MNNPTMDIAGAYAAMTSVQVPDHWSPEQALAVYELLNEVADRVWDRYERSLIRLIQADLQHEHDEREQQFDLFDPDDPILF